MQTFIQLPDDSGNTGKKVGTRTRTQGSDTVHDHVFVIGRTPVTPQYAELLVPSIVETQLLNFVTESTTFIQTIVVTGAQFRFRIKLNGNTICTLQTSAATPASVLMLADCSLSGTITVTAYHEESASKLAQVTCFGYSEV